LSGSDERRAAIQGSIFDIGIVDEPRQKKAKTLPSSAQRRDEASLYEWVRSYLKPLEEYDDAGGRSMRKQARHVVVAHTARMLAAR
jgi:hypothetical protein